MRSRMSGRGAIPVFATQAEVEELQRKRREAKLLESRR